MCNLVQAQFPAALVGSSPFSLFLGAPRSHCEPVSVIVKISTTIDSLKIAYRKHLFPEYMTFALTPRKSVRKNQFGVTAKLPWHALLRGQVIEKFCNSF